MYTNTKWHKEHSWIIVDIALMSVILHFVKPVCQSLKKMSLNFGELEEIIRIL